MKKGGTLVALIGAGPKPKERPAVAGPDGDDLPDDEEDNLGASYTAVSESLARQLNIPEGKRDEFRTTLKEVIHACIRGKYPEEE